MTNRDQNKQHLDIARAPHRQGDQALTIADTLRKEIINGTLLPGQTVRQQALAARFSVSRMPVREALHRLESEGLVTLAPNKGALVAPLTIEDLQEVYEMRIAAECLAMRTAMPHLTNAHIAEAEAIQATIRGADFQAYGGLNARFHHVLYAPCDRPRLLAHVKLVNQLAERYLCMIIDKLNYKARADAEHDALLAACLKRDTPEAERILEAHIRCAGETLVAHMQAANP